MVFNSFFDLMAFFGLDHAVGSHYKEFKSFWDSLSCEEKEYYRSTPLW